MLELKAAYDELTQWLTNLTCCSSPDLSAEKQQIEMMLSELSYRRKASRWQPIETAPREDSCFKTIDLWGKTWVSTKDEFIFDRFTDCYWSNGNPMGGKPHWKNLPEGWCATHWMPKPMGPE